jgi:hypothetical protein
MDLQRDVEPAPLPVNRLLDAEPLFEDVERTTEKLDRTLSTDLSLALDSDTDLWADLKEDLSLRSLLSTEDGQRTGTSSTDTTTQEEKEDGTLLDLVPLLPRK